MGDISLIVIGNSDFEEEINDYVPHSVLVDDWSQLNAEMIAKKVEEECLAGKIPIPTTRTSKRPAKQQVDGSPLPTDEQGNVVVLKTSKTTELTTDEYGHVIYPIKDTDGRPLPTNEAGSKINWLGVPIDFDEVGNPIDPNGIPLPTDASGAFIYPAIDESGKPLPTDINGRPIYKVVDLDGELLPTNADGLSIDHVDRPIPTNFAGRPVDADGSPYPTDHRGRILVDRHRTAYMVASTVHSAVSPDEKLPVTDATEVRADGIWESVVRGDVRGQLEPHSRTLPTIEYGSSRYPHAEHDGKTADSSKKTIYPVIRSDDGLLPTDDRGFPVLTEGPAIATDSVGRPFFTEKGRLLPSDDSGRVYFQEPDSEPLSTDGAGNLVDSQGRPLPIEVDLEGKPIGPHGKMMPVNADRVPLGRKPVVIDLFGRPLPTDSDGGHIYGDGSVVATDSSGRPVGSDGSVMPVDHMGRYISDYMPDTSEIREDLLTEASTCDKVKVSANIIFMVESSVLTKTKVNELKTMLPNFIRRNIDWNVSKIGLLAYGSTAVVGMEIGNYRSFEDLTDSIRNLPTVDGTAANDEHALRTALELFREDHDNDNGEIIVHIHMTLVRSAFLYFSTNMITNAS